MALTACSLGPLATVSHRARNSCSSRKIPSGASSRVSLPSSVVVNRRELPLRGRSGLITGGVRRRAPGLDARKRLRESVVVFAAENGNDMKGSGTEAAETSDSDVEALEARIGVGRRARKQSEKDGVSPKPYPKAPTKPWDSMNLVEKAWSIYIDPEKGVLFWLNKLAYGAIYTIIGGWIIFRFVGPALGWYELDQPLLTPDRLLDGGP